MSGKHGRVKLMRKQETRLKHSQNRRQETDVCCYCIIIVVYTPPNCTASREFDPAFLRHFFQYSKRWQWYYFALQDQILSTGESWFSSPQKSCCHPPQLPRHPWMWRISTHPFRTNHTVAANPSSDHHNIAKQVVPWILTWTLWYLVDHVALTTPYPSGRAVSWTAHHPIRQTCWKETFTKKLSAPTESLLSVLRQWATLPFWKRLSSSSRWRPRIHIYWRSSNKRRSILPWLEETNCWRIFRVIPYSDQAGIMRGEWGRHDGFRPRLARKKICKIFQLLHKTMNAIFSILSLTNFSIVSLLACVCQVIHTLMKVFVSMNILTHFRGVEASCLRHEW